MRKYILLPALLFFSLIANGQMPQLTVDGKTNNGVTLRSLKIKVDVCGTVARTSWQMTFKNNTSKVLEGTLNFPLKEGLSISRYALDINGKLREAVPIDRGKGREVFEAIERKRVDPGLLEKVDGNTFRTRIYPINPNDTRTILIGYEEELPISAKNALHYYLPLNLKDTVADFSLEVSVIQSARAPLFDSSLNENIQFDKRNNLYSASFNKTNYAPGHSLSFSVPKPMDAAEVMLQEFERKYYYLINTRLESNEIQKKLPSNITVLWDASLSGSNRDIKKELALLDAYFKKVNNATLNLVGFNNSVKETKIFALQNGNWEELKKAIEAIQYDGGTDLGKLNIRNVNTDEFILVSDGHQTIGNKQLQLGSRPIYCISSGVTADYSNLKLIALKTGGELIDLQKNEIGDAVKKLTDQSFKFLGVKQNALVKESYPSMPVTVSNNFAIAGIAEEGIEQIILQFGYGNKVSVEKTIAINTETQLCENFDITKIYAQKKIAELDVQYDKNKQEIEQVGKRFGIVTRNTSLIVLETINDYIQYEVDPPAELKEEYNRIMKQRNTNVITKAKQDLQSSLNMMAVLKNWYDPIPVKKEPVVKIKPKPRPTPRPVTVSASNDRRTTPTTGSSRILSGKVTDNAGNPIPFASVTINGARIGVTADANGSYTIRVHDNDVVNISGAAYSSTNVNIGALVSINTVLERNNSELMEVVVTGAFGTKRSVRSTSSNVQSVSGEQLNYTGQTNVNNALAGKVAGAQVRNQFTFKDGAENIVRLRGENGLATGSNAIYVVDGTIVGDASNINSDDIKDTRIIQGPAAAALFGPEGANGAIVITTKNFKPDTSYKRIQIQTEEIKNPIPDFNAETFDYIKALKQIEKASRYAKYLELRQYYINKPTYFFEVATYFLKTGDKARGITILTNLAELENGNYELYKMLGYKLKEAGEYDAELSAFKKVLELRPTDPQSFRDCALAYADMGNYQQALDMLYEAMTKSYSAEMNRMYSGIEEVFLTEINGIIALQKNELNLNNIDKKIIAAMPSDVRVVMNWNKNNTDIDLWVTDPNGEKCYYGHKVTEMGGRISDDFTEGFGPEQFMLKKGTKGKYRIEINYYSDTQVTMAGPTTIMAEIYLHYGTPQQEKKIITLQMEKGKSGEIFIGEVEL